MATLAALQVFVGAAGAHLLAGGGLDAATARPPVAAASPTPTPVPIVTAGPVLVTGPQGSVPAKGSLAARLTEALGDRALGPSVGAVVVDVAGGDRLFGSRADSGLTPASTTKVVTAAAALTSLGPDTRMATRVVLGKGRSIVLVGGGDVMLAGPGSGKPGTYPRPATLATLAARTAKALKEQKVTSVTLGYDDSLFSGPRTATGWKPGYIPEGSVAPVSALTMDEGRTDPDRDARYADPARSTAEAFRVLLGKYGIKAARSVDRARAPSGAAEVARVESAPVYELVEHMLTVSDNDLAEALAHQVAIKEGRPGSFAGGAQAVQGVLKKLGAAQGVVVYDGSGLSTRNRITPAALARLVSLAASPGHPRLRSLLSGLPVAGFTGTLDNRYGRSDTRQGAGMVRAKTGTLNGVNTLTGLARTAEGRLVAFAFMADEVADPAGAMAALDRLATLVSRCGCS
ncbi:D-alanyl-D-alanine carboxypeptidase/D-alanyl-D-alanine endopeptidase [Sphaerisporangium aureirubrum]|uniref:D-alanyl-D-alanine carboxypeptidase/D-alanyl-D-alanine-endopeptidase n=1 Tax=Sphaerisporangium aureirubrum TaxID=1544736 RepID=A0ABW1NJL6_9ACTN